MALYRKVIFFLEERWFWTGKNFTKKPSFWSLATLFPKIWHFVFQSKTILFVGKNLVFQPETNFFLWKTKNPSFESLAI